jgi:hypothetical protein
MKKKDRIVFLTIFIILMFLIIFNILMLIRNISIFSSLKECYNQIQIEKAE